MDNTSLTSSAKNQSYTSGYEQLEERDSDLSNASTPTTPTTDCAAKAAHFFENHSHFMQTDTPIIYGNGYGGVDDDWTLTTIVYDKLPESTMTSTERAKILESELERRQALPAEERGNFKPQMQHLFFSSVARPDFESSVTVMGPLVEELGITPEAVTTTTRCEFFHNGIEGIPDSVTASDDRSADTVMLARVMRDSEGNAICFTGRPDTLAKAREQASYINPEPTLAKPQRYLVLSLTSPSSIQGPNLLNERNSLRQEHEALDALAEEGLYQPIHIHHCFNAFGEGYKALTDRMSGKDIERPINQSGYALLFDAALETYQDPDASEDTKKAILDILYYLNPERIDLLSLEERFLLTDLLAKMCDIPVVIHCKSSVDRTSVGVSISTINQMIVKNQLTHIPLDSEGRFAFHQLTHNEAYKRLFLAHLNTQHQVCGAARSGIDLAGNRMGRAHYGLNYAKGIISAPAAVALMPKEALVNTHWRWSKYVVAAIMPIAQFLLGGPLLPVYALALAITAIALRMKTGVWKKEFITTLFLLPYSIKFWKIPSLNYARGFDRSADNLFLNGEERHLLHHGKMHHPESSLNLPPILEEDFDLEAAEEELEEEIEEVDTWARDINAVQARPLFPEFDEAALEQELEEFLTAPDSSQVK